MSNVSSLYWDSCVDLIVSNRLDDLIWYRCEGEETDIVVDLNDYLRVLGKYGELEMLEYLYNVNWIKTSQLGLIACGAAESNRSEIFLWMYEKSVTLSDLNESCKIATVNGDLSILQSVYNQFGCLDVENCYTISIHHGHLRIVQWLHNHYPLVHHKLTEVLYIALNARQIVVADWLLSLLPDIQDVDISVEASDNGTFSLAMKHGWIDVLNWIHGNFSDKLQKRQDLLDRGFECASASGNQTTIAWFLKHDYRPSAAAISRVFCHSTKTKRTNSFKWIRQQLVTAGLEVVVPHEMIWAEMIKASNNGHTHELIYLHQTYNESLISENPGFP